MWNLENTSVGTTGKHSDRVKNYFVCEGDRRLNYDEVIELWVQSDSFNEWYTSQLTSHPSKAIRWETPCLTVHNLDRDFEFVLVDSPGLDRPVNQRPFAEKFKDSKANSVITFPNLGRNGIMVVPTPEPENRSYYCHLLSFLRGASTLGKIASVVDREVTNIAINFGAPLEKRCGNASMKFRYG